MFFESFVRLASKILARFPNASRLWYGKLEHFHHYHKINVKNSKPLRRHTGGRRPVRFVFDPFRALAKFFFEPCVVAVSPTSAQLEPFGASHAEGSSFLCVFSKPLAQFWQRVRFLHVSRTLWAEAFSVDPPRGRPTPGVFFRTLRAFGVENFGACFQTLHVFGVENS